MKGKYFTNRLLSYIVSDRGEALAQSATVFDLKAIAEDNNGAEISQVGLVKSEMQA